MSVSATGSGGASAYLRSILQQQPSEKGSRKDPTAVLMDAFYPKGTSATPSSASTSTDTKASASAASGSSSGNTQFSSETFGSIISFQGQQSPKVTARAQAVFT